MSNDGAAFAMPAAASPQSAPAEMLRLSWVQPPGFTALSFKNFALSVVTLGIYKFWGKTEVRKRIWSGIRVNGEPLQYTGTGKEMFLGFLVVLAILTIPTFLVAILMALAFGNSPVANGLFNAVLYGGFLYLIGVGMHRAVRYRLSRTIWRGIRGGLEGSSWRYGWAYFWTGIVLVVTLGWASPWRATRLQSLITNDMRFGNRPFHFDAKPGPLYGPFAALWLSVVAIAMAVGLSMWLMLRGMPGGLETLGPGRAPDPKMLFTLFAILYGGLIVGFLMYAVVSAWYRAQMMNHFAAHTSFEAAKFHGSATGRSLIWLALSNTLMVIFTLGLLAPVAQARSARYFVERLRLDGSASLAEILQRAEDSQSRGEGLAQAFDIDAF